VCNAGVGAKDVIEWNTEVYQETRRTIWKILLHTSQGIRETFVGQDNKLWL
jgi:hypothetical protein